MLREEFPKETRLWTIKRIFMGQKLEPTVVNAAAAANAKNSDERIGIAVQQQEEKAYDDDNAPIGDVTNTKHSKSRTGRNNMMSSVTASDGDFDSVIDALGEEEEALEEVAHLSSSEFASGSNRVPTLEAIGEMSESDLDSTPLYQQRASSSATLSIPAEFDEKVSETNANVGSAVAEGTGDNDMESPMPDSEAVASA